MKTGERRGNAGPWKTRKTKTRFPFVSPRPWKSLRESHIPTAPAMVIFLNRKQIRKPKKGARHIACLNFTLQAHPWIRKCYEAIRTGTRNRVPNWNATRSASTNSNEISISWSTSAKGRY